MRAQLRGGEEIAVAVESAWPRSATPIPFVEKADLPRWLVWVRRYGFVLVAYLGVTSATGAYNMGDTLYYSRLILASKFGEFGHLLWYPLGWSFSHLLMPVNRLMVGADARANVIMTLMTISWLAGLASVFMLHGVVRKISEREWAAYLATIGLIFSQGFLNHVHTACSYSLGLSLLLFGMYLSVTGGKTPGQSSARGWGAGVAFAGAMGLWGNYALAIPAALAFPLLVYGFDKGRWRFVLQSAVAFALATALVYGSAAALQGIHSAADLKDWITSSTHGINRIFGVPRMAFGFARSFINMDNDGTLFKRFVVHDPLNPVSLSDLFRVSLWKLSLFYFVLGSTVVMLLRFERGRRILGFLALTAAPVLAFAVVWQGGDMERYIPLYPAFFVSLACCLSSGRSPRWFKFVVVMFITTAVISSVGTMATPALAHRQNQVIMRIKDLQPLLTPHSLVSTVTLRDEVQTFCSDFPLHPINRAGSLSVDAIVAPGTIQVPWWRQIFGSRTLAAWSAGGDVWVSKRVLSSRPRSEWIWVEGDDPRVLWADIYGFFSGLQMGRSVGGDDGFALLLPSPRNREFLNGWLESGPDSTHVHSADCSP